MIILWTTYLTRQHWIACGNVPQTSGLSGAGTFMRLRITKYVRR